MKIEHLFVDCIPILAALVGVLNTFIKYMLGRKKNPNAIFKFLKGEDFLSIDDDLELPKHSQKTLRAQKEADMEVLSEIAQKLNEIADKINEIANSEK